MSRRGSVLLAGILAVLWGWLAPSSALAADVEAASDRCSKEQCIDRRAFYQGLAQFSRRHVLAQDPKRLDPRSFAAMQDVLNRWDTDPVLTDTRWLAYIVATVFWETGGLLHAVREGLCDTDECVLAHLEEQWRRRELRRRYWDPDPSTGQSYYGRGQVQLTHLANYARVGGKLEMGRLSEEFAEFERKLVLQPDLALENDVSTAALVEGMVLGWYNTPPGKGLAYYINEETSNDRQAYAEARRTVNVLNKNQRIAQYAVEIHRFIQTAPASSVPSMSMADATAPVEGASQLEDERTVQGRRPREVDEDRVVGPERDEVERYEPNRDPVDHGRPVGPIRNATGVIAGAAAAAGSGNLRTPPTKKELRERKKRRKQRERRRKKRQKKRKKRQKKQKKRR